MILSSTARWGKVENQEKLEEQLNGVSAWYG
jgi:hypothetical protein